MMKFLVELLLVTVLYGAATHAVFIEAPKHIMLLPEDSELLFNTIFKPEVFTEVNDSVIFNAENECKDQIQRALVTGLAQCSGTFHECYGLTDEDVKRFMAVSNETQLMQEFQEDMNKCALGNAHNYEFNCYVSVMQIYLQKIDSYIHAYKDSFELIPYNKLSSMHYKKLAYCTGNNLKFLMESAYKLNQVFVLC